MKCSTWDLHSHKTNLITIETCKTFCLPVHRRNTILLMWRSKVGFAAEPRTTTCEFLYALSFKSIIISSCVYSVQATHVSVTFSCSYDKVSWQFWGVFFFNETAQKVLKKKRYDLAPEKKNHLWLSIGLNWLWLFAKQVYANTKKMIFMTHISTYTASMILDHLFQSRVKWLFCPECEI